VLAVTACGAVVAATEAMAIPLLRRAAIVDVPGHRSSHAVPTPRGGGIPVAAGLLVAAGLIGGLDAVFFALAVVAFGMLGTAEDVRGLTVRGRLALQAYGALLVAVLLVSGLAAPAPVLGLLVLLCTAWITGFVNAFNFMDGVNGISAMFAILAGVVYAVVGLREDLPLLSGAATVVAVAASTFLPWNAGRAKIFLGDVGSYGLGAALAGLAAYAALHGVPLEAAVAPLAVYLADTGFTLVRRMRAGEDWLRPHRTHVYQRLTDLDWSHLRVALAGTLVAALVSLCALAGSGLAAVPRTALDVAGLVLLVGYLMAPGFLAARRPAPRPAGVDAGPLVRQTARRTTTRRDTTRRTTASTVRQAGPAEDTDLPGTHSPGTDSQDRDTEGWTSHV
jgi:UDP-N-acetylmuramyl pentapeptide phosphotransferase/UDP-N-acetylglucosamine-1-phosphate transferase